MDLGKFLVIWSKMGLGHVWGKHVHQVMIFIDLGTPLKPLWKLGLMIEWITHFFILIFSFRTSSQRETWGLTMWAWRNRVTELSEWGASHWNQIGWALTTWPRLGHDVRFDFGMLTVDLLTWVDLYRIHGWIQGFSLRLDLVWFDWWVLETVVSLQAVVSWSRDYGEFPLNV